MKDLHALAYRYYQAFYSYREHIGLLSVYTFLVVVIFFIFIGSFVCLFFAQQDPHPILTKVGLERVAFGSEILFIVVWLSVNAIKERRAKKKVGLALKRDFKYLEDAKRAWLESIIDIPRRDYLRLAKELSDSLALTEKHRTSLGPSVKSIFRSIYDPDSKSRVVSLLIFLFSVASLILMRAYDSESIPVSNIFEAYDQPKDVILFIAITAVLLWLFMIALVYSKDFILAILSSMNIWIDGKQSQSASNANRLIQALVQNAAIPRKRVRADSDAAGSA